MDKYQEIAAEVCNAVGGDKNVASYTNCMTRLRLTLVDRSIVDVDTVKDIDGVIRVVEEETFQIVLGPGTVNKVAEHFGEIVDPSN